ncbi:chloramphenicol phosphotransferase CPT family protein [Aestuariivirga sp.]|uniref:chloramphenicol phosphotransferase CPT family protein n=1 Tax=Aestuariivirga sp. TaxID=2650926 RepID=UPI0039E58EFE
MSRAGRIVHLNGVGSVGKSSIARAIQEQSEDIWLHVQMDSFLEMLPSRYMDHDDGLRFVHLNRTPAEVEIRSGPVVERVLSAMPGAVAALVRCGNNVIVDDVLIENDASAYRSAWEGLDVLWVGVVAPLNVIEARERNRGDRDIGLARWQFERVHCNMRYDLTCDAGSASPAEIASLILARIARVFE